MKCHACYDATLEVFLPYGEMPMGNGFLKPGSEDAKFPMSVAYCSECHTVQLERPVPHEVLKGVYQNYRYVPTGKTLEEHYAKLGEELAMMAPGRSRCLDIGSNSGILLQSIRKTRPELQVKGIEPAEEISEQARKSGIPTLTGFFDLANAQRLLSPRTYDLVTLTQVFQHLPNPGEVLFLIRALTKDVSTLVVEGRDILTTITEGAWDSHYQELVFEYGALSLCGLMERMGFQVFDAKRDPVYGGSLRVYVDKVPRADSFQVRDAKQAEREAGLDRFETYEEYGKKALASAQEIGEKVKGMGGTIAAFGAPSTGTTLLNASHLSSKDVAFAVDDNPMKRGLQIPGTGIVIEEPKAIVERGADTVLLLPWRLKDDIISRLKALGFRGKVLVPLPKMEILEVG